MNKRDDDGLPLEMPNQAGLWLWRGVGGKFMLFRDGTRIDVSTEDEVAVLFLQARAFLRASHHPAADEIPMRRWRPGEDPDDPANGRNN